MRITEQKKIFYSLLFPALILLVIWGIKLFEYFDNTSLSYLGVYPRKVEGLIGLITSPLIHGDFYHLINNTIPFLVLYSLIYYFYRNISFRILLFTWLFSGLFVWVFGRTSHHIGLSGVIYGLFGFLLLTGFLKKQNQLLAISFMVIFVYGSMVWGIFPEKREISWEGHMGGFLAGMAMALIYRKKGPQQKKFDWQEDDDDEIDDNQQWQEQEQIINYTYIPKENKDK